LIDAAIEEQILAGRVAALALADSTPLRHGIPIRLDGKVIGAIGVTWSCADNPRSELLYAGRCSRRCLLPPAVKLDAKTRSSSQD
jgi:hypothetical protein